MVGNKPGRNAIRSAFGDFSSFRDKFAAAAAGRFGSGFGHAVGGTLAATTYNSGKLALFSAPQRPTVRSFR